MRAIQITEFVGPEVRTPAEAVGRTAAGRRVVALVDGGGYAELAVAPEALAFDLGDAVPVGAALRDRSSTGKLVLDPSR